MEKHLLYFCYSLLTYLLLPFSLLRLLWRSLKAPAYRKRWTERLGWYGGKAPVAKPCVIFHAVSVGEVHAAQPLIELFMQSHPALGIVVTTATPTGAARVSALFGARVEHVYLPWDLPGATRRFMQHYQPQLLVLLETELWPNLLKACATRACKVVLANARLSEKSFRAYQRFAGLSRQMLQTLAMVAAQSDADGKRFLALGLQTDRLVINGSLKFDVSINQDQVDAACQLKSSWQQRPVWIAASTREGEETLVLQACLQVLAQLPTSLLVLVPRHPERFGLAGREAAGLGLQVQYFSSGEALRSSTQVLIGDSMGDMQFYYSLSEVAFVGGSLVPTGCQNLIEPAALGLPVLAGPSLYNFQKISELLCAAGGMQVVRDSQELGAKVMELLQDEALRAGMGSKAKAEVLRNQGAAARLERLLARLLAGSLV